MDMDLNLSANEEPTFPIGWLAATTSAGFIHGGHIGREFTTAMPKRQADSCRGRML